MQASNAELSLDDVIHLQALTQELAGVFRERLEKSLQALAPLFRMRRILGSYIEGGPGETVPQAAQNLKELRELYERVAPRPFGLRTELPPLLEPPSTDIQLQLWQYTREIQVGSARRALTIFSPFRWILSYPTAYSAHTLWPLLGGTQEMDSSSLRQFVLSACMIEMLFRKRPELREIFSALRFTIETRTVPRFGDLPLLTVSAPAQTICPADNVLTHAIGLSGSPSFQEVADLHSVREMRDPLQVQIEAVLLKHKSALI